ncbi:deoxyribose-phosphate aldolase [hydrocarbon metagenome]|uniref:deoxyribose-phosphate aldolase n=1 Tax=hydrocarbon metagenome TaxID=938273 RepID=A0A0W8E6R2_9ZZZZ
MLASYLDSTNLKPDCRKEDIVILCERAAELNMAAVCINPSRVLLANQILKGTRVGVCTVIGFPLGATAARNKLREAEQALLEGACELDVVINIGAVKDQDFETAADEIRMLLQLRKDYDYLLKIIVETALLSAAELKRMTVLIGDLGADYIKTSTGFSSRGVSLDDLAIINASKRTELKVKASGGIKTLDFVLQLVNAGVDRIGSSSAEEILSAYRSAHSL